MKRLEFHSEGEDEYLAAIAWYRERSPGTATRFVESVELACARLVEFPRIGRSFGPRNRRVTVPGFPYAVVYRVEPSRIYVLAVMHLSRDPGYWRSQ